VEEERGSCSLVSFDRCYTWPRNSIYQNVLTSELTGLGVRSAGRVDSEHYHREPRGVELSLVRRKSEAYFRRIFAPSTGGPDNSADTNHALNALTSQIHAASDE
jgi:hypothetical protein